MAKKPTLTSVTSGYASNTTLNSNNQAIEDAFDNTLSLDGSTPNAMQADLDLDSNDILNAGTINVDTLKVAGATLVSATAVPNWEGPWLTATPYVVNDLVQEMGNTYICTIAHTSGTFATDLAAGNWELFAAQGASGAGTGDLVASNNGSDFTNADTVLANLGGGSTGIAIFKDTSAASVRTEIGLGTAAVLNTSTDSDFTNDTSDLANRGVIAAEIAAQVDMVLQNTIATEQIASGTEVAFSSIPAGTSRITLYLQGASFVGTDNLLLQIGGSGGIETIGYNASSNAGTSNQTSSNGFIVYGAVASASFNGLVSLEHFGGNRWGSSHSVYLAGFGGVLGGGTKVLSSELTQLRVISGGGSSFTGGIVNISYS